MLHNNLLPKSRLFYLLIAVVVFTILLALGFIFYLDNNTSNKTTGSDLKGFSTLTEKVKNLSSDPKIKKDPEYDKVYAKLLRVGDRSLSTQDRYNSLQRSVIFLQSLYSNTNEPKLRYLIEDYKNFAKLNFFKYYKDDFSYPCQDSECAPNASSEEIKAIINRINNSDILDDYKPIFTKNLENGMYLSDKTPSQKVGYFFSIANNILENKQSSKTGANIVIANDVFAYLKNKFPKEFDSLYKKANISVTATPTK